MDFVHDLTVTAGATKAEPIEETLPSFAGVVHQVEVEFPPGCGGEVYAAVRQGVHQVWPTNPDGYYRSDARVYSAREHLLVKKGDAPLVIQGWGPDAAYDHKLQFRLSVLPRSTMEPMLDLVNLFKKFLKFIGAEKKGGGR